MTDTGLNVVDFRTEYRGMASFPRALAPSALLVSVSDPKLPSMPALRVEASSAKSTSRASGVSRIPLTFEGVSVVSSDEAKPLVIGGVYES